jgi:hypothetical protein
MAVHHPVTPITPTVRVLHTDPGTARWSPADDDRTSPLSTLVDIGYRLHPLLAAQMDVVRDQDEPTPLRYVVNHERREIQPAPQASIVYPSGARSFLAGLKELHPGSIEFLRTIVSGKEPVDCVVITEADGRLSFEPAPAQALLPIT